MFEEVSSVHFPHCFYLSDTVVIYDVPKGHYVIYFHGLYEDT